MLKICFSCEVSQGLGMTENVACTSRGNPNDRGSVGNCGVVQVGTLAKVVDVPEMGYTSEDKPYPRGELCLKGPFNTPGYLHDPANTAKLIDKDGWLHTGDIAELDSSARVRIVDRVKNVVKLSQGEYVALEKLESIYTLDPLFASLVVHADSTRSHLVALAVLDPLKAASLVQNVLGTKLSSEDLNGLERAVNDKRVRREVIKNLAKIGREKKLNGFEMIKGVYLTLKPFPESVLTPTLKVKRNVAAKMFQKEIDSVYKESETEKGEEGEKMRAKL